MVDYLRRFNQHIGLMKRLEEAAQAEQEGKVLGLQYGDIPLLGGLARPLGAGLNTVGLGLEGLGTAGKAIAGEVALPIAMLQNYSDRQGAGGNSAVSETAQEITAPGIQEALIHPGRTVDALRRSKDTPTAYLGGILEMVSDPSNALTFEASAAAKGAKEAATAARLGRTANLSEDFFKGQADDAAKAVAAKMEAEVAEKAKLAEQEAFAQNRQRVDELRGQWGQAKQKVEATRGELDFARGEYHAARGLVDEEVSAARKAGGFFEKLPRKNDPRRAEVEAFNNEMKSEIAGKVLPELGEGAPRQGQTFEDYTADPYKAFRASVDEERQIAALYKRAVKNIPQPKGKKAASRALGEVNESFDADPNLAGMVGVDDPQAPMDLDALIHNLEPDSPDAIAAGVGRVANATELAPVPASEVPKDLVMEATDPFTTRMKSLISTALQQGRRAQREAMNAERGPLGFKQVVSVWKGQATQTMKNLLQDEAFSRLVAMDAGIRNAVFNANKSYIINRLGEMGPDAKGLYEHPLAHLGMPSDVLGSMGYLDRLPKDKYEEAVEQLGLSMFEAETKNARSLNAMQYMFVNGGLGLLNPARAAVNVALTPLGYAGPMRQEMFKIINNVTHMAAKGAAFEQGFSPVIENSARVLLRAAEAEGLDISQLAGKGVVRDGERIMQEGMFSPQQVSAILDGVDDGKTLGRFGQEWSRMVEEAVQAGYQRSNEVFGNYSKRGPLEKHLDIFFPFMSWAWRAYPRVARMALSHPYVTAGLIQLWEADAKQAEAEGRPAYQVPTIGINRETPFVGLLARVFSPEQEAELRVNPLSFLLPFGGDNFAAFSDQKPEDQTGYQKAEDILGIAGLGFNPLIQTGAYIHGDDFQAPAPASRYANIDQAVDDVTGISLEAPSLAHGTLRAAREAVSGKKDTYDPVVNKARELIYERTGLPAADRRNVKLALQLEDPDSPLMREAERVLDTTGATRTSVNAVSPFPFMVNIETNTQRRQARKDLPYSFDDIQAMKEVAPTVAMVMQRENDQYERTHPAAAIQKKPDISERDRTIARGAQKRALLEQLYGTGSR